MTRTTRTGSLWEPRDPDARSPLEGVPVRAPTPAEVREGRSDAEEHLAARVAELERVVAQLADAAGICFELPEEE